MAEEKKTTNNRVTKNKKAKKQKNKSTIQKKREHKKKQMSNRRKMEKKKIKSAEKFPTSTKRLPSERVKKEQNIAKHNSKDEEEKVDYSKAIRVMFGYDRRNYYEGESEEESDMDMESTQKEIDEEEAYSLQQGQWEDEQELRRGAIIL